MEILFGLWDFLTRIDYSLILGIIGIYIAFQGLETWKKQLKGNTEYEVSRKILQSVYQIRDGVQVIRNPMLWAYESRYSGDEKGLSAEQIRLFGEQEAYIKRFTILNEAKQKILVDILEAEVLWGKEGKDLRKMVYELFLQVRKMEVAIEDHFRFSKMSSRELSGDTYYHKRNPEIHSIMYSAQPGVFVVEALPEDKFGTELEKIIIPIDNYLRQFLYKK